MKVDLTGFVNASGKPIAVDPQSPSFVAKPRAKSEGPQAFHKGWVVEGYAPDWIAEEERLAREETARWQAQSHEAMQKALTAGQRAPKPWDLDQWRAKHKPKKLRNRPFEVEAAADQFAAMCRQAGYLFVAVQEVKRGTLQLQGEFA